MAERGQIPTMVEKEIGAGGPGFVAESDSLQIELDDVAPTLPEGIEIKNCEKKEKREKTPNPKNHPPKIKKKRGLSPYPPPPTKKKKKK